MNGRADRTTDFLCSVADALGVPPESLLAFRLEVVAEWLRAHPEETNEAWDEIQRGPLLEPYEHWPVRPLPDPRTVSLADVAKSLIAIVKIEGPVLGGRAYSLRLRAAGLYTGTRELRSVLNKASFAAIKAGAIIGLNEFPGPTQKFLVLRIPGSPEVRVRTRGERSVSEIPLAELAEVVASTRAYRLGEPVAEVQNAVLALYGIASPRLADLEHINRAINMKSGQ